jgi:voltage-gated potassium channel Kch
MRLLREDGPLKVGWDILICAIALTTGLLLPLELLQGTAYLHELTPWWTAFSAIGLTDVVVTFFTSFEQDGLLVRDRSVIARRYLRSWFSLDVAANLPFFLSSLHSHHVSLIGILPLLRLQQLVRITSRWQSLQLLQSSIIRIIRYGLAIVLIANWGACLWLWIGLQQTGPEGWIQRLGLVRDNFPDLYLHSLYWTITTLATVGYGDITPKTTAEIILAILMMITGVSLYAFAVGNVVSIVNDLDEGRTYHAKRQSAIASYLSRSKVEPEIIQKVRRFNDYQWSRTRGFRPSEMFTDLPEELHSEVMFGILRETVQRVPLFTASPLSLQKRLLLLLKPVSYPPGTVVFEANEIGDEILFMTQGTVRIETKEPLSDDVLTVGSGDYIGDLSFFLNEPRTCSVLAHTYVDAFILTRDIFENLREKEPQLRGALQAMARQQSQRNQALLLAGIVV